ncbi:MAG: hypothetical protein H0V54_12415 [Chthoniobacterales bacterium]|nr:hypothetical protein [Chthoniobacterales bacterium]
MKAAELSVTKVSGIGASEATQNVVVTHYWITDLWVDDNGKGQSRYEQNHSHLD